MSAKSMMRDLGYTEVACSDSVAVSILDSYVESIHKCKTVDDFNELEKKVRLESSKQRALYREEIEREVKICCFKTVPYRYELVATRQILSVLALCIRLRLLEAKGKLYKNQATILSPLL